MTVPPETRRKNRWLVLGLIVFALALALSVFIWMRATIRANGGVVDPHYSMMQPGTRPGLQPQKI
jgi:hypothetical protein